MVITKFTKTRNPYIIILYGFHEFVKNSEPTIYEISVAQNTTQSIPKLKKADTKPKRIINKHYQTCNTKTEVKTTRINNWEIVNKKCELYKLFSQGKRRLHHHELLGLSLSLMYIQGGETRILETIKKYPDLYNKEKDQNWKEWLKYFKKCQYVPESCEKFCPFKDTCHHYSNIRDTITPKNAIYQLQESISYFPVQKGYEMLVKELGKRVI